MKAVPVTFLLAFLAVLGRLMLHPTFFGRGHRRKEPSPGQVPQQSEDEKAAASYCEQLRANPLFTGLQILNLKGILKLEEASIQLKLYEQPTGTGESKQVQSLAPAVALARFRCIVALGDAGTGKTTLLRSLALASASGSSEGLPDLPVLVSLPDFVRSRSSRLLDYTFERLEQHMGGRRHFLEEKLNKGELLLLFDGLDEIQASHNADGEMLYRLVANQLNALTKKYPQAAIVVTCRRAGWRGALPQFVPLELVEFGWEDIQDFIRRWAESRHRPELYRPLAMALLQSVGVRSLAATPFLLALICLVFERRGMLPQRRSELYGWCVDVMLVQAEAAGRHSNASYQLNSLYKQALLRKIALHFHQRGQRDFPRDELLQVINPFLRELKFGQEATGPILAELVSEQGLLREQGDGLYGFAHISLQEYFVAEAIAENQHYDMLAGVLDQLWWQEVIILLTGLGDADRVMRLVQEAPGDRPAMLALACRCLANQPPVTNPDLTIAVMVEAMQEVLDIGRPIEQKAPVIEALSQVKNPAIIDYFSKIFQMRDVQYFLRWDLYARVVLNLVQLGFAESYRVVFQLLVRPEIDADLKQKLIDAAVIVGEAAGAVMDLRTILPALTGDVRAKAVLVLLQRGDTTLVTPAVVLLRERQINANLKRRLLGVLSTLLTPAEFVKQIQPLLRPNALSETSLQLRALELAVGRGGPEAVALLLKRLAEAPTRFTPELGQRLILMAGRFGSAEVLRHLLRLLEASSTERTLEPKVVIEDALKRQALAAIVVLVTVEHSLLLRHWLRNAPVDYYSQCIAALAQSLNETEDTRAITHRFLATQKSGRLDLEKQLRQIATDTRRSMAALPSSNSSANDTQYFYGWPMGSY